jgi:HD-like signal output (HDOD) protein
MEPDHDHRIQAILASGIKIPPMPEILLRLNRLLSNPETGPTELASLIRDDGALSGAVFRVVGSPVFGLHAKVDSLQRAIALLGMRNAAALLRNETLRSALSDPLHAKALQSLWNRSELIAERCVLIVKTAHLCDISPDSAFMLGMFHDCGLALLCKRYPAYAEALSGNSWPDILALDQTHQISHSVMGQMVAKNWALPDELVLAIRHHHDLHAPELPLAMLRLCAVLQLAIHLHAPSQVDDELAWRTEILQRLELNADALTELETNLAGELTTMSPPD